MERFRRRISVLVLLGVLISLAGMSRSYAASEAGPRAEKIVMDINKKDNNYKDNYFLIEDFAEKKNPMGEFELIINNLTEDNYKEIRRIRFKDKYSSRQAIIEMSDKSYEEIIKEHEDPKNQSEDKTYDIGFIALSKKEGLKLKGRMGSQAKKVLSYGNDFKEGDNSRTAAGDYEIYVDYKNSRKSEKIKIEIIESDSKKSFDKIILRDRPRVIATNPAANESHVNYNRLYRRYRMKDDNGEEKIEEGYYLELQFEDFGGEISLIEDLPARNIIIKALGQDGGNLYDPGKSLQFDEKNSRVYIPLRDKLENNLEYEVVIAKESLVENTRYFSTDGDQKGIRNKQYSWRFSTNYLAKADLLYEGSVVEDYDPYYPIAIDGELFNRNTEVIFKSETGDYYRPDRVRLRYLDDKKQRLYIYLPVRRMPVGNYSIILDNGRDFEIESEQGVLSIVKAGEHMVNEEYKVKRDEYYGDIKSILDTSLDILEINNLKEKEVRVNLDELMGYDTWSRIIKYPEKYKNQNEKIILESKDFQAELVGLGFIGGEKEILAGRAPVVRVEGLKNQLYGKSIRSEFIEIDSDGIFGDFKLTMPYKGGNPARLKLAQYDQLTREFKVLNSVVDEVNMTVEANPDSFGIFVVIE